MNRNSSGSFVTLCALLILCGRGITAELRVFEQVGFDQRLDGQIPLSLEFRDHTGRTVRLGRYFGEKPTVLSLVYYECPMLCTLELNGLLRSLKAVGLSAGDDFTVLTVSFDPEETPELAARKRESYLKQLDGGSAHDGWHFLTGEESNIRRLCEAVGFHYAYDPERDEYAHPSGIVLLTPEGRIARYLYGIDYAAKDLRLGLVEASEGKIGSPTDQLLLLCYGYDPATGKYGLLVIRLLRLGGLITVIALGGFVGLMLYRERRIRRLSVCDASAWTTHEEDKPACQHEPP
jgi:protein SCO1/2